MSRIRTLDRIVLATLAVAAVPTVLPVVGSVTHVAAGPAAATPGAYTVKSGDFLVGIATKLKVGLSDLLAVNHLQLTSLILPGQQLVVPTGGVLPTANPASPAPAPAAAPAATQYVIKAGDSLGAIAGKLKVSLADLLAANNLTATSLILPGQKLNVPSGGSLPAAAPAATPAGPAAAPAAAGPYVVKSGDYLFGIATALHVSIAALLSANNLTATSLILPGQQLVVPAGGSLPSPTAALTAGSSAAPPVDPATRVGTSVDTVVDFALAQVGKPYRFFAAGPDAYDCSGLVVASYRQIGLGVIHQSLAQSLLGQPVDWKNAAIRPGDLIFTARGGGDPNIVGHVGIAISGDHWVNAPRTGDVVKTGWIPPDSKILAVRRLVP
jgi:LysM repeat protein